MPGEEGLSGTLLISFQNILVIVAQGVLDTEPLLGALLKVSGDFGGCKILVLLWFVPQHGAFSMIIQPQSGLG